MPGHYVSEHDPVVHYMKSPTKVFHCDAQRFARCSAQEARFDAYLDWVQRIAGNRRLPGYNTVSPIDNCSQLRVQCGE
jgi:hypothetical protein